METTKTEPSKRLWGGRFSGKTDPILEKCNSSISYDKAMWEVDVKGSLVYARALRNVDIISETDLQAIEKGLNQIADEWEKGSFELQQSDEDIHTANERRLKELIGSPAGKLHTGRSRNDQVATDMRLWLREQVGMSANFLEELITILVDRAHGEIGILMPGYTHLQRAQPIRWSHWLLSYAWMLRRDFDRLEQLGRRVNECPLGSGALAGNPFGIDRDFIATALGFDSVMMNSLDATSDRDFVSEYLFWASLTGVHLSRLAEDLILYSTKEFDFIQLSDAYSTGSSLMPQKKNADSLELIRGKAGKLYGNCTTMMMVSKGLPSTYNKDLQECQQVMYDSTESIQTVIQLAAGVVYTLKVKENKCMQALSSDMLATDLAYYLVRRGIPFREAHELSGKCVALSEMLKVDLLDLSVTQLKTVSETFSDDVADVWNYENSVEQYSSSGGTSRASVAEQVAVLRKWLTKLKGDDNL